MGDRGAPVPVGKAGAGSLAEFEYLLASFDLLPKAEKKPFTTLLEIANYPHSELACSNILAFFLNPDEEHKLGSLVLNSLFSVLRDRIGQKILNADHRCWVYLLDFITTIQNLQKREAQMNKESLNFFRTHERTVLEFYWKLQALAEYLRSKTKEESSELRVPSCFDHPRFWVSLSDKSQTQIYDSVFLDTTLAGIAVRTEAYTSFEAGWQIEVWPQGADRTKLMNWLATNRIQPVRQNGEKWIYAEF